MTIYKKIYKKASLQLKSSRVALKLTNRLRKPLPLLTAPHLKIWKTQTKLWKNHRWSCTPFQKLMWVQTQCSLQETSKEAFQFAAQLHAFLFQHNNIWIWISFMKIDWLWHCGFQYIMGWVEQTCTWVVLLYSTCHKSGTCNKK